MFRTKERKIEILEEKLIKAEARKRVLEGYTAKNQYGFNQIVKAEQDVEIIKKRLERLVETKAESEE